MKNYKSIHDIYEALNAQEGSKPAKIIIGANGKEARLVDKVLALARLLKQDAEASSKPLSIKLDDPTGTVACFSTSIYVLRVSSISLTSAYTNSAITSLDALVTMLAASRIADETGIKPPLMLFNSSGITNYTSSPVAVSSADLQTLKTIPSERRSDGNGTVYLVNSGPQPANMDPEKFLPAQWKVARRIGVENMPTSSVSDGAEKVGNKQGEKHDTAATFVRMQVVSGVTEGIVEIAHRVSS